tara:strand:- start:4102 stop:4266 length:165 start_codon:yes stop_codon:yes gene_type:complete
MYELINVSLVQPMVEIRIKNNMDSWTFKCDTNVKKKPNSRFKLGFIMIESLSKS